MNQNEALRETLLSLLQAHDTAQAIETVKRLRDIESKARALLDTMETPRSQKASDAWWALTTAVKS